MLREHFAEPISLIRREGFACDAAPADAGSVTRLVCLREERVDASALNWDFADTMRILGLAPLVVVSVVACATGGGSGGDSTTLATASSATGAGGSQATSGSGGAGGAASTASAGGSTADSTSASSNSATVNSASSSTGGALDITGACDAFCAKLETCNGTSPATCKATCSTDFQDCDGPQLDKVKECAMGACGAFQSCISGASCVGNGN